MKPFILSKKQKEALAILQGEEMFNLLYGGSRSGKTVLIMLFIVYQCLTVPGLKAMVARYRFNDVKMKILNETLPEVWGMISETSLKKYINHQDYYLTFPNGSKLFFGGVADKDQADKVLGAEYDLIFINEARQVSWETFELLRTRLNGKGKLKFICDTNPPNQGKNHWIYRYFIEKKNNRGDDLSEFAHKNTLAVLMNPSDNPNLHESYLEILRSGSELSFKRYGLGQFISGGEYPIYDFKENNEVEDPLLYDARCEHWVGWDFGVRNPTAMIYFQIREVPQEENPTGYIIEVLDEYQTGGKVVKHFSDHHKKKERWSYYRHAGDPSARASGVNLISWKSELLREGIRLNTPKSYEIDHWVMVTNEFMPSVKINRSQTPMTYDMLINWQYTEDEKPDVDSEYSHLGTAFYYFFAIRFAKRRTEVINL